MTRAENKRHNHYLYCVTCAETCPMRGVDNGCGSMKFLLNHLPDLLALKELLEEGNFYLGLQAHGIGPIHLEWLHQHKEHTMGVTSEFDGVVYVHKPCKPGTVHWSEIRCELASHGLLLEGPERTLALQWFHANDNHHDVNYTSQGRLVYSNEVDWEGFKP